MENIKEIMSLAACSVSLFIALVTFVLKFVKSNRAKRVLNETLRISEAIAPMIVRAEEFLNYTGAEKKQFVLTSANRFAIENNLAFDENRVSELVEELVETTKKVNSRTKDLTGSSMPPSVKNCI